EYLNVHFTVKSNNMTFNNLSCLIEQSKWKTRHAVIFYLKMALLLLIIFSINAGCTFSFKGTNISDEVKTYYVGNFKLTALNAPATINQTFQESLKDKISKESRLKYTEENPNLEFNGTIQSYNVSAVAPLPDEKTSFNRLTISVAVEYTNHLDPKDQWTKTFSHFEDFPSEQDLLQIQDDLIAVIFKQIQED